MINDRLLSFEEFTKIGDDKIPTTRYNFLGYWSTGLIRDFFEKVQHYVKFKQENPDLDKRLLKQIGDFRVSRKNKINEKDLYEAYKIMYGFNPCNSEILGQVVLN